MPRIFPPAKLSATEAGSGPTSPGGSEGEIQINIGGVFGTDGDLVWDTGLQVVGHNLFTTDAVDESPLKVRGFENQESNLFEWLDDSNNVLGSISENGYFTTRKVAAPADGELVASEVSLWFDDTDGAAKLMMKGKSIA